MSCKRHWRGPSVLAVARSRDAVGSAGARRQQGTGGHQPQELGGTRGSTSSRPTRLLTSEHLQILIEKPDLFEPWICSTRLERHELCPWSWCAGMAFWGLYPTGVGWKSEEEEVRPTNRRRCLRHAFVHIWPYICSPQLLQMVAIDAY